MLSVLTESGEFNSNYSNGSVLANNSNNQPRKGGPAEVPKSTSRDLQCGENENCKSTRYDTYALETEEGPNDDSGELSPMS